MISIWALRKADGARYGAKAANLGEVARNGLGQVPYGVAVETGDDITQNVEWMSFRGQHQRWAVRSSGASEDGERASFAGQHLTVLDLQHGKVVKAIEACRKSTGDSAMYADALGVQHETRMTVIVQKMVSAAVSGVAFTHYPGYDEKRGLIEAVEGLGDGLVGGTRSPTITADFDAMTGTTIGSNRSSMRAVARLGMHLFKHWQQAVDFEWALDKSEGLWCLQVRPITTVVNPFMVGRGIGQSVVRGVVQRRPSSGPFVEGSVLVTDMTKPNMVGDMVKAVAIVTEIGGRTCHAAIVARELGKPCVVGYPAASSLRDGQVVEVNSITGTVIVV